MQPSCIRPPAPARRLPWWYVQLRYQSVRCCNCDTCGRYKIILYYMLLFPPTNMVPWLYPYLRLEKGIQSGLWLVKISFVSDRKKKHRNKIVPYSAIVGYIMIVSILSFLKKMRNIEHGQITIFSIPDICDIVIWACSIFFRTLSMLPQHAVRICCQHKKQSETVQNMKFYKLLSWLSKSPLGMQEMPFAGFQISDSRSP